MPNADKKSQIRELKTYYQQYHHTLVGWQITLSGFVFAALLAADAGHIAEKWLAVAAIWFAILAFPLVFLDQISRYGCRIKKLEDYLKLEESQIPENWETAHKDITGKGIGRITGAGSCFFVVVTLGQLAVNALLAFARLHK